MESRARGRSGLMRGLSDHPVSHVRASSNSRQKARRGFPRRALSWPQVQPASARRNSNRDGDTGTRRRNTAGSRGAAGSDRTGSTAGSRADSRSNCRNTAGSKDAARSSRRNNRRRRAPSRTRTRTTAAFAVFGSVRYPQRGQRQHTQSSFSKQSHDTLLYQPLLADPFGRLTRPIPRENVSRVAPLLSGLSYGATLELT